MLGTRSWGACKWTSDEITLSYTTGGPSYVRKQTLKAYFGFDCACELCSLPADQLNESDARPQRTQELDEALGDSKRVRHRPLDALADCHALHNIYQQERITDLRLPRLYHDAFQICAMHSDVARATVFAERSCAARVLCEREDSQNVAEENVLAANPGTFENFDVTKMWAKRRDGQDSGIPRDLDEETFELWLWRRMDMGPAPTGNT